MKINRRMFQHGTVRGIFVGIFLAMPILLSRERRYGNKPWRTPSSFNDRYRNKQTVSTEFYSVFEKISSSNYNFDRRYILRNIILILLIAVSFSFCARVTSNIELGNQCALGDLWREAIFRWEKALEENEHKAIIYNNIGIAYEKLGQKEKALEFYKKSLTLAPDNEYIKRNLARCRGEERGMTNFTKKKGRKNDKKN